MKPTAIDRELAQAIITAAAGYDVLLAVEKVEIVLRGGHVIEIEALPDETFAYTLTERPF